MPLGELTNLTSLQLQDCVTLHTPPPPIINAGKDDVQQFLCDMAKGSQSCYLVKLVLLGDEKAGKSSFADSLMLGHPTTRADNDRTVGIEVRRWRVGGNSLLVVNIYDAAGQLVYRTTHGFFMSAGALFLHVVRSDVPEDTSVAALLEWVEAVQQEAPGAVMSIVWTHADCFNDSVCHRGWRQGYMKLAGAAGTNEKWMDMWYLQRSGVICRLEKVGLVTIRDLAVQANAPAFTLRNADADEDVRGKVAVMHIAKDNGQRSAVVEKISKALLDLDPRGALAVIAIVSDQLFDQHNELKAMLASIPASSIPIMIIPAREHDTLTQSTALTAFPGVCW